MGWKFETAVEGIRARILTTAAGGADFPGTKFDPSGESNGPTLASRKRKRNQGKAVEIAARLLIVFSRLAAGQCSTIKCRRSSGC
jgi:hypothetical protein